MSFIKHKNKTVFEKGLLVQIIHTLKESQETKFHEFDCLTGYLDIFLCYLKPILFLCYLLSCTSFGT